MIQIEVYKFQFYAAPLWYIFQEVNIINPLWVFVYQFLGANIMEMILALLTD
jgi:hypothetical protein